jgi:hypothetical protein
MSGPDFGLQAQQPIGTVGIVQRYAGGHLRNIGWRVVGIAFDMWKIQCRRQSLADLALPASADSHDDPTHWPGRAQV